MAKILDVQNLTISFSIHGRKLHAVRGVSFDLNEGEAIGIVGESGCGKSVTVQSLTRLIPSPPSLIETGQVFYRRNRFAPGVTAIFAIRARIGDRHDISRSDDLSQSHDENRGADHGGAALSSALLPKRGRRERASNSCISSAFRNPSSDFLNFPIS